MKEKEELKENVAPEAQVEEDKEFTEQDLTEWVTNVSQALLNMAKMFNEMTIKIETLENRIKALEDKN